MKIFTQAIVILFAAITLNLFSSISGFGQAPGWQWARSGQSDDNHAYGVATDGAGNVYVAGSFSGTSIIFGSDTLINSGGTDMYLVKYDGGGSVIWARAYGGNDGDEEAYGVAVDTSGNVFVTGYFQSTSVTFGTTTLTNAASGALDMFIVKFSSAGAVLWAKRAGSAGDDPGTAVATDKSGNVFVGGNFSSSSIVFGSTTLNNASTSTTNDLFIAKYDAGGNVLWAKSAGGTDEDYLYSVATDGSGNVFAAGSFTSNSIAFGSFTCTNSTASYTDVFVAKYNNTGTAQWAKSGGGSDNDAAAGVIADASGNCYMTGTFISATATFSGNVLTNAGGGLDDIFLLKYDGSGNLQWAISAGSTDDEVVHSIARDLSGNVFISGTYNGAALTFGSTTLTNSGKYDLFVTKYNSAGNVLWARGTGGTDNDAATTIATDAIGNAYLAGYFLSPSIVFGPTTITNSGTLSNSFLARLASTANTESIFAKNNFVKIYPNPVSEILNISIPAEIKNGLLIVSDMMGKEIISSTLSGEKEFNFNVGSLSKGIYFVQLKDEEKNYCERIIKE